MTVMAHATPIVFRNARILDAVAGEVVGEHDVLVLDGRIREVSTSRLSASNATVVDSAAKWNLVMAVALLAMIPPVIVVIAMQRQFVKGLVETEK